MNSSKALRIGGFALAVGVTASLAGFAAHGTGAYFSDAKDGSANVSTGSVKVNTGNLSLDFTNLLPGVYKTQQVQYAAAGTGPEDVYLAFDQAGDAPLNAFNNPQGPTPLGRYGHLEVSSLAGTFQSNNLATDPNASHPGADVSGTSCNTDQTTGLGGSDDIAVRDDASSSANNGYGDPSQQGNGSFSHTPLYCPAPEYILLAKGLQSGDGTQTASIEFGFTKFLDNNAQAGQTSSPLPFRIVAEQAGVSPYDANTTNRGPNGE